MRKAEWVLFLDGGSRGNPGPGASGAVLYHNGEMIKRTGKYFPRCTNNYAEYQSVVLGLNAAKKLGATYLECYMDSQLVVRQMNGQYRIKHPELKKIFWDIQASLEEFTRVTFHHVPRAQNKEADRVVNEILDSHTL